MTEDKVKELREELRIGRNQTIDDASITTGGTSSDTQGHSRGNNREEQSIPSDIFGSGSKDDAANEPHNDFERSLDKITERGRSTNRRSSKSGSSSSSSSETITGPKRRAGRLVADDPIPIREKSKNTRAGSRSSDVEVQTSTKEEKTLTVQRGKKTGENREPVVEGKSEKQGFKLPTFKEGSTLSISEAKALEEPLQSALEADFHYIDQFIWYRTKDESQAPVWSDMDNDDIQILANVLLKSGQKSPAAAATVRGIVNGSTYADVTMLMIPRIVKTAQVLNNAPKIQRPGFMERKRIIREG